jgi:hypothetical protein
MEVQEHFKVVWMSKATGAIKTFVFDSFQDDPQNKRTLFINEELDKVLTIYYDDLSYMITAPYRYE